MEASNFVKMFKDGSKLRRILEGVPAGLKYGAVTLPLAAATTKIALDQYDDVADRFARVRLRRQLRHDALKKLAYEALGDKRGDEALQRAILAASGIPAEEEEEDDSRSRIFGRNPYNLRGA